MEELIEKLRRDTALSRDKCIVIAMESTITGKSVWDIAELFGFSDSQSELAAPLDRGDIEFDVDTFVPDPECLALISETSAKNFRVLPLWIDRERNILTVAYANALNVLDRDRIQREVGDLVRVAYCSVSSADLNQAIDRSFGVSHQLNDIANALATDFFLQRAGTDTGASSLRSLPDELPSPAGTGSIGQLVDALLQDAVSRAASDIHLSPEACFIRIQYRIDGTLTDVCVLHIVFWSAVLVRIKVLAGLDIAETRLPQDGHITRVINGRQVDYRVASFPLVTGENIVLRVLDRHRRLYSIDGIASSEPLAEALLRMVNQPSGLILVCGPTGCGKTTTLYAMLASLDASALNIMTLEDPVEYPITGIRQTTIQPSLKMGFAEGLRGILRQDPDVLLVGEIRDKASCAMTCRAAMTGHLVLTSLHAPDCLSAIARLLDLGAERSVLSASLCGVVAQRLVKRICTDCDGDDGHCRRCSGTGYRGRTAIMEHLSITPEFAERLQSAETLAGLAAQARQDGFTSFAEKAISAVADGLTTRQEIERVFGKSTIRDVAASHFGEEADASIPCSAEASDDGAKQ